MATIRLPIRPAAPQIISFGFIFSPYPPLWYILIIAVLNTIGKSCDYFSLMLKGANDKN
jgi:hypothetical protein